MTRIQVAALLLLACTVHSTKLVGLYSVWVGNDNYNRSFAFIDTSSQTSSMINWGIDDWGEGSGVVSQVVQDPQQGPVLYWVRSKIRDNVASSMLYAQPLSASKPVTTPLVMYPNSTSSIQVDPKRPGWLFMNQFVEFGSPLQLTYFNPSTRTWANSCQAPFSFLGALDYDRRLWFGGTDFTGLLDASVTDMNNCASYDITLTCVSNPADFQLDRITYDGRLKKFIILAWDSTGLFGFALDSGTWQCNTLFSVLEVETAPWWNEAYNPATSKAVGVLRQDISKQASVLTVYDLAANRTSEVVKGPMISGLDFWQLTSLAFVDQGL